MLRINIGCGQTPTKGWRNFDNSFSLKLSRFPILAFALGKLHLLDAAQYEFIQYAHSNVVESGDAAKRLPVSDRSVDVLYSSHMLEHLDRNEAGVFLREARRMLRPGGIIRIAVPDISKHVKQYINVGDADAFIEATRMCIPRRRSLVQKLRFLLVGTRNHQWMYDGNSLCSLLHKHGFENARVCPPGETKIEAYGPLDLYERQSESVYVEAEQPCADQCA